MGLRPTILYMIYDGDIKSYLVPVVDPQYVQEIFTDSIVKILYMAIMKQIVY
jgi:hypothetical protein